jgi:hypothetical protein
MGYRGFRGGMGMRGGAYLRRRALSNIMLGALFTVIGIVVTAVSYNAAANSATGGVYYVPWGFIVIGVIWMIRGFALLARSSRLP